MDASRCDDRQAILQNLDLQVISLAQDLQQDSLAVRYELDPILPVSLRSRDISSVDRTVCSCRFELYADDWLSRRIIVFRGWDESLSCPVALKILNWANVFDRPAAMKQLRMEAATLSRVKLAANLNSLEEVFVLLLPDSKAKEGKAP